MAHTASLSQLQSPPWASVNGQIVPYKDVRIHISAEALTRALSVFEGVKGYWTTDGVAFAVRTPREHYERLLRSASLLQIPVDFDYSEFVARLKNLAARLLTPDQDMWFRPTLFVTEGHWGEGTRASLIITAFKQQKEGNQALRLGVSTWRRGTDLDLPARVKCSANYVVARLARIEARRLGYDDAILLNRQGRVAEATGSCIVALIDDEIVTPPPSEGSLDSLTVRVLQKICDRDGLSMVRRPLERTEILSAQEIGIAGTISELTSVSEVDGYKFSINGLLSELRASYVRVMRGEDELEDIEMRILTSCM